MSDMTSTRDRKKLVVLLDGSSSMGELYRGRSRFEAALQMIKAFCSEIPKTFGVELVVFGDGAREPLSFEGPEELLAEWDTRVMEYLSGYPRGGSAIWDCLGMQAERVISTSAPGTQVKIFLITDGQDNRSIVYKDEKAVRDALLAGKTEIDDLTVVYLGDDTDDKSRLEDLIRSIGGGIFGPEITLDDSQLKQIAKSMKGPSIPPPLPIRVPVLSFLDGEDNSSLSGTTEEVEKIQGLAAQAIAFLEELTGLRYYPVPTLLVPRNVVADLREHTELYTVRLKRIARILLSLCLAIHVRCYLDREEEHALISFLCDQKPENPKPVWLPHICLRDKYRCQLIHGLCEGAVLGNAIEYINGGTFRVYIDGTSDCPSQVKELLEYVIQLLDEVSRMRPGRRFRHWAQGYWGGAGMLEPADRAFMKGWLAERNLPYWGDTPGEEPEVSTVRDILKVLGEELVEGLRQVKRHKSRIHAFFIEDVPTYGLYVPRGPQGVHSSSSGFLKARHNKQPDIGMQAFGKVLLSNSAIKDFGNELAELLGASSMVIDDRGFGIKYELPHHLRPKWEHLTTAFLQSVIIHEHAHAIFAEGIGEHGR
ncbi:MAG TPA: VWA domain-containing protein, partial [Firmicutes bacterium]|nr:VWA domain-containing protein [Bacillota bacterium]